MSQSMNICMKWRWTSKKTPEVLNSINSSIQQWEEKWREIAPEGTHRLQRKKEFIARGDLERTETKACRGAYAWESASHPAKRQEGTSSVSDLHLVNVRNSLHQVLQINREPCRVPPMHLYPNPLSPFYVTNHFCVAKDVHQQITNVIQRAEKLTQLNLWPKWQITLI